MNGSMWPLSENQRKKLRGVERDDYETWLDEHEREQRTIANEAYELSNERLKARIEQLEERIAALEPGNR